MCPFDEKYLFLILTLVNDFLLVYIVDSNDKIIIICVAGGSRAEKHLLANWDQTMCSYKH